MLIKDIVWGYRGSDTIMVAYGYPVYRKVRRGKKFYWKLQYLVEFHTLCRYFQVVSWPFLDILFEYSIMLEAVAIYPQIILFTIKKGEIESYTSNFIAFQGLSTIFILIFWYLNYGFVNDRYSLLLGGFSGYVIIGSEILQLIFMGYYFYLYFKSIMKSKKRKKFDI